MKVELNRAQLQRLADDLELPDDLFELIRVAPKDARVEQQLGKGGEVYGLYQRGTRRITLFIDLDFQVANRLRFITSELNRTLLHEVRHLWQDRNWPAADWVENKIEPDAERFAWENSSKYTCVKVTRPKVRNGFTKLAAAEGRVRRS